MYNRNVGTLEEYILLLLVIMREDAYSVTLAEAYKKQTGKSISIPAIHTVLRQLEKKDFVKSKIGGSTKARGGRSKRIYEITATGYNTIKQIQEERSNLWKLAPKLTFN